MIKKDIEEFETYGEKFSKQNEDYLGSLIRVIIYIFVAVILIVLVMQCFYTIGAGQRGIIVTLGKPSNVAQTEGLHFKIPIIQSVVIFDIKTQKDELDASAASADLQTVTAKIAINYHLISDSVPRIYTEIGVNYVDRVLNPAIQEVTKAITAQFTAEELITKREIVIDKITALLKERMVDKGIVVERVLITNFDFSKSFNDAIEAKVTAEQNALAAKNKLEQVKYEAQQTIEAAKGKADAIQIEGDALKSNPQVTQLRAIEKWNGIMPQVTGGAIPFISINGATATA